MLLQTYWQMIRSFGRDARLLLLGVAVVGFALDGTIAVLLNLYLLRLGYGPEFVGVVNSGGLLVFALCSLPAGMVGSRWGSRRVMMTGYGIGVVGGVVLSLAELLPATVQPAVLVGSYMVIMLGMSLVFVNMGPYLMAITTPQQRSHAFAVQSALLSLAAFGGSLLAGFLPGWLAVGLGVSLDEPVAYRYPLLGAALLLGVGLVLLGQTERLTRQQRKLAGEVLPPGVVQTAVSPLTQPLLIILAATALIRFLQVAGVGTMFTFFNVYYDKGLSIPTATIGIITALGRLLAVPAALSTSLLAGRWGNGRLILFASLLTSAFMLPLALVPNWLVGGLGYVGAMAFTSMRFPAFVVYSLELVPESRRATLNGVNEMAAGLSFSLMALGGGYLIASFGYRELFLLGSGITAVGTLIFYLFHTRQSAIALQPAGD